MSTFLGEPHLRVTVNRLRSGQPRPYADSEDVYQILVEHIPYGKTTWVPEWHPAMIEQVARGAVRAPDDGPHPWPQHRTDYVRHVLANGQTSEIAPERSTTGIVEIRIVEPYVD